MSFEVYDKDEWLVCSPMLRDWTAAFIVSDKADSARENMVKWRRLTRKNLHEIDSTEIIKKQLSVGSL